MAGMATAKISAQLLLFAAIIYCLCGGTDGNGNKEARDTMKKANELAAVHEQANGSGKGKRKGIVKRMLSAVKRACRKLIFWRKKNGRQSKSKRRLEEQLREVQQKLTTILGHLDTTNKQRSAGSQATSGIHSSMGGDTNSRHSTQELLGSKQALYSKHCSDETAIGSTFPVPDTVSALFQDALYDPGRHETVDQYSRWRREWTMRASIFLTIARVEEGRSYESRLPKLYWHDNMPSINWDSAELQLLDQTISAATGRSRGRDDAGSSSLSCSEAKALGGVGMFFVRNLGRVIKEPLPDEITSDYDYSEAVSTQQPWEFYEHQLSLNMRQFCEATVNANCLQ